MPSRFFTAEQWEVLQKQHRRDRRRSWVAYVILSIGIVAGLWGNRVAVKRADTARQAGCIQQMEVKRLYNETNELLNKNPGKATIFIPNFNLTLPRDYLEEQRSRLEEQLLGYDRLKC